MNRLSRITNQAKVSLLVRILVYHAAQMSPYKYIYAEFGLFVQAKRVRPQQTSKKKVIVGYKTITQTDCFPLADLLTLCPELALRHQNQQS